jgi:glycogen operon protein
VTALGLAPEQAAQEAQVAAAAHGFLARARSQLVLVQAEDLAGEREAQNVPGTDRERPNWRRRIGISLERLWDSGPARAILQAVRAERGLTFDRTTVSDADGTAVPR